QAQVIRTDVYRWAGQWQPPREPVNVFISPPFADFQQRPEDLLALIADVQRKTAEDSVVVVQTERIKGQDQLPELTDWEERRYGRNVLLIWVKPPAA
ncbi:MAG TPA: hypothetical protein VE988_29640, partial [Gemmataceae bacterium]|nr:hypothetical protein [Gemmataceae bacterium]